MPEEFRRQRSDHGVDLRNRRDGILLASVGLWIRIINGTNNGARLILAPLGPPSLLSTVCSPFPGSDAFPNRLLAAIRSGSHMRQIKGFYHHRSKSVFSPTAGLPGFEGRGIPLASAYSRPHSRVFAGYRTFSGRH